MKAEPMSWVFVWGMVFDGATVEILQEKKKDGIIGMTEDTVIGNFVQDSLTSLIFSKVSIAGYIVYIRYASSQSLMVFGWLYSSIPR